MQQPRPRIAIPIPTSTEPDYNQRTWPQYASAVTNAGGEAVAVPLTLSQREVADLVSTCQGVLLPGAAPDMNPQKYGAERIPACNPDDPARENVDELLLQDAHNLHKPIFGICYGTQGLNVWRTGTLLQDLAPMPVNHRGGRSVAVAHTVVIDPQSMLAQIVRESSEEFVEFATAGDTKEAAGFSAASGRNESTPPDSFATPLRMNVNSSHHQAVAIPGDGLRVSARCPQDAVIEAIEGTAAGHFVLGVQWHPERTCDTSAASRALFARFVAEVAAWKPRSVTESVVTEAISR
jgi:putative glutamine amidotransferase